jgi:hypothetical protein
MGPVFALVLCSENRGSAPFYLALWVILCMGSARKPASVLVQPG